MATKTAVPNGNGTLSRSHAAEVQEQKVAIAPKRRKTSSKKAEDEGLLASLCTLVCDHQIGMSL
jgi:acyl-CoA-dependent ceramide synthase